MPGPKQPNTEDVSDVLSESNVPSKEEFQQTKTADLFDNVNKPSSEAEVKEIDTAQPSPGETGKPATDSNTEQDLAEHEKNTPVLEDTENSVKETAPQQTKIAKEDNQVTESEESKIAKGDNQVTESEESNEMGITTDVYDEMGDNCEMTNNVGESLAASTDMGQSLAAMHEFGASEMLDSDENEGFVPANEGK